MSSFLSQKKHRFQFNESDDEGMIDLLEATITPPRSPMEQPSVAEEDRVGSSDHVMVLVILRAALEAVEVVAGTTSVVSAGLSTTALHLEDRAKEVMPPTLKGAGLESSPGVEREDVARHLPAVDGAGLLVVLAPRGLPCSLSRCLWGRPVLILD